MAVVKLGRKVRPQDKLTRDGIPGPSVRLGLPDVRGVGGRPTGLTNELIDEFEKLLAVVSYIETVGDLLGISGATWKFWIRDGRAEQKNIDTVPGYTPDPRRALHLRMFKVYLSSLAQFQLRNITKIHTAGDRDWRASAWLLERRFYAQWGDKSRDVADLKRAVEEMEKSIAKTKSSTPARPSPIPTNKEESEHGDYPDDPRDGAPQGGGEGSPQAQGG